MYGIFIYIYLEIQPNVGKYASHMDPMGLEIEDSKLEKSRSLAVKGGKPCWPHVFSWSLSMEPVSNVRKVCGNFVKHVFFGDPKLEKNPQHFHFDARNGSA